MKKQKPKFKTLIWQTFTLNTQKSESMEQYEEQEHEVYGGEIPDEEGEVDADMSGGAEDYEGNEHDLEHDPNSNSKVTPLFLDFFFF